MKKYIIALLLSLSAICRADWPLVLQCANSAWYTGYGNSDFYWYPDRGPDFEAKIYTATVQSDGSRVYNNYFTKNYGSSDTFLDDTFNTTTTRDPLYRGTCIFILLRYHYAYVSYENMWVDAAGGYVYPAAMVLDWWHPGSQWWSENMLTIINDNYWTLYAVNFNDYYNSIVVSQLAYGQTYTYPSNIQSWWSYGQN